MVSVFCFQYIYIWRWGIKCIVEKKRLGFDTASYKAYNRKLHYFHPCV
jgi:hypothetical protein